MPSACASNYCQVDVRFALDSTSFKFLWNVSLDGQTAVACNLPRQRIATGHDRRRPHPLYPLSCPSNYCEVGDHFGIDATSGTLLWNLNLGGQTAASPVTYLVNGLQQVTIAVGHTLYRLWPAQVTTAKSASTLASMAPVASSSGISIWAAKPPLRP